MKNLTNRIEKLTIDSFSLDLRKVYKFNKIFDYFYKKLEQSQYTLIDLLDEDKNLNILYKLFHNEELFYNYVEWFGDKTLAGFIEILKHCDSDFIRDRDFLNLIYRADASINDVISSYIFAVIEEIFHECKHIYRFGD